MLGQPAGKLAQTASLLTELAELTNHSRRVAVVWRTHACQSIKWNEGMKAKDREEKEEREREREKRKRKEEHAPSR